MNTKNLFGLILLAGTVAVSVTTIAYGDDHRWGEPDEGYFRAAADIPPVKNNLYKTECGSCHFAFQPGWLPARSWQRMMNNLDDHFGDNAELDSTTHQTITQFLVDNSADRSPNRQSRKILRSLSDNEAPQRISELRYLKHEHDEIPDRMLAGNPKVGSRSNCLACHADAEKGVFDEHGVNIPGFGRWDD